MEVISFRFLNLDDTKNPKYEAWSRIYEYPFVLDALTKLGASSNSTIHNTCWGFLSCHIEFKNDLDKLCNNVLHSDIRPSNLKNTIIYDATKKIEDKYINYFDFVINVSTIEEINHPNIEVFNNLLEQVKPGGYLIVTFDYDKNNCSSYGQGSMNLSEVETYVGQSCTPLEINSINGSNSILPQHYFQNLNCGILILKKNSM